MSEEMIDSNVSHGELTLVINEDHNYFMVEKSIRAKGDELSDNERNRLIENGKRIGQN